MMRSSVLACALCTEASAGLLPAWLDQDFALGFMEGVLDGEDQDFALCLVNGILPPVQEGDLALHDIKAGLKAKNLSEIADGLAAVGDAIKDSHELLPACSDALGDGSHIKNVTQQIQNISAFFRHVEDDMASDKDDLIGKEFESAMQAFAKKDHSAFGQHLGMLLHRIFVEPEFPKERRLASGNVAIVEEQLRLALPPWMSQDFALGFFEGLLDDKGMDFALCVVNGFLPIVQQGAAAVSDMKGGIKDKNLTRVADSLREASSTMHAFHDLGAHCQNATSDASAAIAVLKSLHGPKAWLKHIEGNFDHDLANLESEADAAIKGYHEKQYSEFGQHLGSFLHRAIVGPFPNTASIVV